MGRERQRRLPYADPRERQRERIDKRLQGGRQAAGTRRKRRAAPSGARQGRARRSVTRGRGTEHDRPALAIDLQVPAIVTAVNQCRFLDLFTVLTDTDAGMLWLDAMLASWVRAMHRK